MKYYRESSVSSFGGGQAIFMSDVIRNAKWKSGTQVGITLTDDNAIVIEKLNRHIMRQFIRQETKLSQVAVNAVLGSQEDFFKQIGVLKK